MEISKATACLTKENAVKNMGGSTRLYNKHLQRFLSSYADSCHRLQQMIDGNQIDEAIILSHSVKGLAGTLGLADLYEASARLELALKEGHSNISQLLAVYNSTLKFTLNE